MTDEPTSDETTRAVKRALSRTSLPSLDRDLLAASVVTGVDVHGGVATVVVDPEACPETASETLMTTVMEAVQEVPAIEQVDVERVSDGPDIEGSVEDFDQIIAVASAKGGVGKSTVATHLAAAMAEDREVALFDADVHGPNVPRLFDIEGPVYSTDDGNPIPIEHDGIEVMSVGLLESDVPLAWRGAMVHDAVSDLFAETAWRNSDTLVIDLPPGTGDVVLTTLQEVPVDGLVVVTTPFHTSISDTNRTVSLFRDEGVPVLGAVVNMAEFTCECCGEPNDLFEDSVADLQTETLARLPFDHELQGTPAPGDLPDAIAALPGTITAELDAMADYTPPSDAVDIRGLPPAARRQQVRDQFTSLDEGEQFVVVSDRDPSPVREFLANVAEVDPDVISPFEVERKTPESWELTTTHP